jgi:hypothetical protein
LHGASRPKDQACWVICFSWNKGGQEVLVRKQPAACRRSPLSSVGYPNARPDRKIPRLVLLPRIQSGP